MGMASGVELLRAERGMLAFVARSLGITRSAVSRWEVVPAARVLDVERATGSLGSGSDPCPGRSGVPAMSIATATLLPSPAPRQQHEARLQRAVDQFLSISLPDDALHFAIPNGLMRSKKAAARAKGEGVRAGIPDLCVIHRGRALFIELKAGAGRVSAAQRAMAMKLIYCGAEVMVCRSVEDVEAQLREACVHLRASVAA